MPDAYLRYVKDVEARLASLGHDVVWTQTGKQLQHGVCRTCGMTVVISREDGFFRSRGRALNEACVG